MRKNTLKEVPDLSPYLLRCNLSPIYRHARARSGRALVGNVPSYLRPITSARLVTSPAAHLAVLFGGVPFSLLHHELSPSPLHQVIPLGILTCGNRSIFKRKERWRREETSWGGAIVPAAAAPLLCSSSPEISSEQLSTPTFFYSISISPRRLSAFYQNWLQGRHDVSIVKSRDAVLQN